MPDSEPLDDLIVYRSSQTSGDCLTVLSHPEVPARDLPLLEYLLERCGVRLEGGSERVSIVMNCAQTRTVTYPMVSAYLDQAGSRLGSGSPCWWALRSSQR